jgi:hypothetical protein
MGDAETFTPEFGIIHPGFPLNLTRQFRLSIRLMTANASDSGEYTILYSKNDHLAERMPLMSSESVPADPGWDEDPAWPDRDPVSPAEREAWLDRLCARDDDPSDQPQEYWDPDSSRRRRVRTS